MKTASSICIALVLSLLSFMICLAEEPSGLGGSGSIYYTPLPLADNIGRIVVKLPGYIDQEVLDKMIASSAGNDLVLRVQPSQTMGAEIARISDPAPNNWYWHFESEVILDHFGNKNLYVMPTVKLVGIATEAVLDMGKSGRICEVYGHQWRDGRPGETVVEGYGYITTQLRYADYHPTTNFRTCKVCGICQQQDLSWK
jgi:hypothetical protein